MEGDVAIHLTDLAVHRKDTTNPLPKGVPPKAHTRRAAPRKEGEVAKTDPFSEPVSQLLPIANSTIYACGVVPEITGSDSASSI